MIRPILCLALTMVVASGLPAQAPDQTIRLTLRPASAPVPALKHVLMPEVGSQVASNAATRYYRAILLVGKGLDVQQNEKLDKWGKMPLTDLPREEMRIFLKHYRNVFQELERASLCNHCDWDMVERLRRDGFGTLLPEVQEMRMFARLLRARARLEMADGHLDQAVHTIRVGLVCARHTADAPILISALVGLVIANFMADQMDTLRELPGSPNLYWALVALPRPFIGMQKPMQGERLMIEYLLPGFRDTMKGEVLTPKQANAITAKLKQALSMLEGSKESWEMQVGLALFTAKMYGEGKILLRARGVPADRLEAMPMLQVAYMASLSEYDRYFDDMLKWATVPYWQARAGLLDVENQLKAARTRGSSVSYLATMLIPAMTKVHFSTARLERRLAALRCLEALRLHAAAHDGKLPDKLDAVTVVPIPIDPVTGKTFEYQRDGDKFTLFGPPPTGEQPWTGNNIRYEIRFIR